MYKAEFEGEKFLISKSPYVTLYHKPLVKSVSAYDQFGFIANLEMLCSRALKRCFI